MPPAVTNAIGILESRGFTKGEALALLLPVIGEAYREVAAETAEGPDDLWGDTPGEALREFGAAFAKMADDVDPQGATPAGGQAPRDLFADRPTAPRPRQRATEQLRAALDVCRSTLATSSRDWNASVGDARLWALLVGYCCEQDHEHDDECRGDADFRLIAARYGWNATTKALFRAHRRAISAAQTPTETHLPALEQS